MGEGRRGQDKFLKEWFSKERPIPGETETVTVTPFVRFLLLFPPAPKSRNQSFAPLRVGRINSIKPVYK